MGQIGDMELGKNLREYREKCGFSQQEIAEKLNLTRQSISRWETGKCYPDLENLVMMAKLYRVSVDDLLKDSEHMDFEAERNEKISEKETDISQEINIKLLMLLIIMVLPSVPLFGIIIYCVMLKKSNKQRIFGISFKVLCVLEMIYCLYVIVS